MKPEMRGSVVKCGEGSLYIGRGIYEVHVRLPMNSDAMETVVKYM